jgi:hypothetical protein
MPPPQVALLNLIVRANVTTSTRVAPAARSAEDAAETVAPLV